MLKRYLWAAGILTVTAAALLLSPQVSEAQRRGGGFRGRVGISRGGWGGYGGGYRGGYIGRGYGGYGYRGLGYGGLGYGGSGLGYGGLGYGGLGYGGFGYGLGGLGFGGLGLGYGRYGYGGYGGYGGSYGGYGGSYGYPSYGYSSYYAAPGYSYGSTYSPAVSPYSGTTQASQSFYPSSTSGNIVPAGGVPSLRSNQVRVLVVVPNPNAQVLFDGNPTRQRGTEREFVTEMAPGTKGTYQVTARWTENGQMHEETRNVRVRAGQGRVVDFNQSLGTASINPTPRPAVNVDVRGTPRPANEELSPAPAPAPNPAPANPAPRDDSLNRNPGNPGSASGFSGGVGRPQLPPGSPKDDNPRP